MFESKDFFFYYFWLKYSERAFAGNPTNFKGILSTPVTSPNLSFLEAYLHFAAVNEVSCREIWSWTVCEKCPYSECFWSLFSHVQTEYGSE